RVVVVEPVPGAELPDPPPKLTTKQAAVLDYLRQRGQPVEQRELMRQTTCGLAVIDALVAKGFARKSTARVERVVEEDGPVRRLPNGLRELRASRERERPEEEAPVAHAPGSPIILNPDQV